MHRELVTACGELWHSFLFGKKSKNLASLTSCLTCADNVVTCLMVKVARVGGLVGGR